MQLIKASAGIGICCRCRHNRRRHNTSTETASTTATETTNGATTEGPSPEGATTKTGATASGASTSSPSAATAAKNSTARVTSAHGASAGCFATGGTTRSSTFTFAATFTLTFAATNAHATVGVLTGEIERVITFVGLLIARATFARLRAFGTVSGFTCVWIELGEHRLDLRERVRHGGNGALRDEPHVFRRSRGGRLDDRSHHIGIRAGTFDRSLHNLTSTVR